MIRKKEGNLSVVQEFPDPEEAEEKLILKIRLHMETHESYLDASLSINQLAKQLNYARP